MLTSPLIAVFHYFYFNLLVLVCLYASVCNVGFIKITKSVATAWNSQSKIGKFYPKKNPKFPLILSKLHIIFTTHFKQCAPSKINKWKGVIWGRSTHSHAHYRWPIMAVMKFHRKIMITIIIIIIMLNWWLFRMRIDIKLWPRIMCARFAAPLVQQKCGTSPSAWCGGSEGGQEPGGA